MIEKVYELSKVFCSSESLPEKLSEPSDRENGYFVVVNLDDKVYNGLSSFEPSSVGKKLLYVRVLGNMSTNPSPTINLQGIPKKPNEDKKKLGDVLNRFINFFDDEKTKHIYNVLRENKERILNDLYEKDAKVRQKAVLSIMIRENGREFLPSERDEIVDVFLRRQLSHKEEGYNKCFLCGKDVKSYPQLNEVFKFATFDKPGFTPSISKKYDGIISICDDCRADLKAARTFIENNLGYNFYTGDTMWIIPYSKDEKIVKKIVDKLKNITVDDVKGEKKVTKDDIRKFSKVEKIVQRKLSEEEESISYDFVLLSISNNEEKIQMQASDVSPSRLSKIVNESDELINTFGDKYNVNFGSFLFIFKSPKSKSVGKTDYYELVQSIYEGRTYSKEKLLSYLMRWIRNNVVSSDSNALMGNVIYSGYFAFVHYLYLVRLGVLKGGEKVQGEGFFERYSEFFDVSWKKAVFLTGVLTGYILDYQQRKRGSSPFVKKLKGLKMRKEDVQGLLPEIKAKALQYKIHEDDPAAYESFEREFERASSFFMEAGNWNASVDEINFVFSTGMAMFRRFIRREDKDEQE